MDRDVASSESSHVQSRVGRGSTVCQPIENSPVYFSNAGVKAQTSSLSNHDLVQKALELSSVSPCKINRQSGHYFTQTPEEVYERKDEGSASENVKYTTLKPIKDNLTGSITQNIGIHNFIDRRFQASSSKPNANKNAKIINHEHVPNVSRACSTPNSIYPGNEEIFTPLSDAHSSSTGMPMVIKFSQNQVLLNMPMTVASGCSELKCSSGTELRPISFLKRLTDTRKTNQPVSESYNSISDPSEESLVSLIDSVNEYSENQTRCLSDFAPSEMSPIKQGSFDLLATSMSPQLTTETPPTVKKTTGTSSLETMECRVCNKRVPIVSLKIHMKKHASEKHLRAPYILDQTSKSGSTILSDYKVKRKVNHQPKRYVCPICRKRYTRSSYLQIHARIHTGETPFSCSICNKKFKYKRALVEHVADHKQIKLYHCNICDKEYSRQSGFDAHRRNHRKSDDVTPKADIVVADKKTVPTVKTTVPLDTDVADEVSAALDSHNLYTRKEQGFACSICEKHCAEEHSIRTHIESHVLDVDQSYTCSMCDEKLPSVNALKSHIVQHAVDIYNNSLAAAPVPDLNKKSISRSVSSHSVEEITNPLDTSDTVNTSNEVDSKKPQKPSSSKEKTGNEHVKLIKSSNRIRNRKSNPTKKIVGKLLSSRDYDLDSAADDAEFQGIGVVFDDDSNCEEADGNVIFCSECGKVLKSEKQLTLHLKTHQPSKFVCNECGRDYKTRHNYQKHLTWHETKQEVKAKRNRKAECEICEKSVRLDCMNSHIRTHTGERPYQCDYCGATFKQSTHLRSHIKIHTGEKPHQCIYCGQVFRKTGNLVVHMRNHTGEKPYKCNVCDKSFKHLAIYKEHLASHRGVALYQCKFCGRKYKSRSGYDCHKRRNHKKDAIFKCYSCSVIYKTSTEVLACSCVKGSLLNKSSDDAPSQPIVTEVVPLDETITSCQSFSHNDAPMSSIYSYSSMMGLLNPTPTDDEIILTSFQH